MSAAPIPISLIVDDPPVNSCYWLRRQAEEFGIAQPPRGEFGLFVQHWRRQEPSKIIPNDFWARFGRWARAAGVKGKFTFLPCPAGLGCVDDKVEGYSRESLSELLALVREEYQPSFDITPEIMTHSMAWDLQERRLLPITEYEWMSQQSEETLADYMAAAVRLLRKVGLNPTGITQPCNFRGDEDLYARAVLRAMKEAAGLRRTFYFLNCEAESVSVKSPVKIADAAAGDYCVSVVSAIRPDEPFWQSLYGEGDIEVMADYFISADGRRGRFVDLLQAGSPIIFHAHGQTLFSNGTERGFQSLQLVVDRVARHLGGRVQWLMTREFVDYRLRQEGLIGNG